MRRVNIARLAGGNDVARLIGIAEIIDAAVTGAMNCRIGSRARHAAVSPKQSEGPAVHFDFAIEEPSDERERSKRPVHINGLVRVAPAPASGRCPISLGEFDY